VGEKDSLFESAAPLRRRAFDSVCQVPIELTDQFCRDRLIEMLYEEWSEERDIESLRRLHTAIGQILAASSDGGEELRDSAS
jgi:hypothetical protein